MSHPPHSLNGKTAWLISDGKTGSDSQSRGIAEALGLVYETKSVSSSGIRRILSPWIAPSPSHKIGSPGSQFAPPWPDVVMAASRLSIPFLRAVRNASRGQTFAIILLDPRTGPSVADIIWVPQHDRLRAPNVITSLTPPHNFSPQRLEKLRANPVAELAALASPKIMIALGGQNSIYRYSEESIDRFAGALISLSKTGASFMITPSRRTPPQLLTATLNATNSSPRSVWDGKGQNPYADYLANADAIIVTADSISMTSEACATGRPVFVFKPAGGSAKFSRFHDALERYGATRPLPNQLSDLPNWSYDPLYSTPKIANQIEDYWRKNHAIRD